MYCVFLLKKKKKKKFFDIMIFIHIFYILYLFFKITKKITLRKAETPFFILRNKIVFAFVWVM